jgi:hypothetical protein
VGVKKNPAHLARVAQLECAVSDDWGHECGGRITCHHPIGIEWRGMSQKAKDEEVIPLCEAHHQHSRNAIHLMGRKPWEQKYGSQRELLEATLAKLDT